MIKVEYMLDDLDDGEFDVKEDRGRLEIRIGRHLTPEQIVIGLNEVSQSILAGGHWFQEWKGDIITMDSHICDETNRIPQQRPNLYDVNRPESGAA
ncbi:hypothetical protein [Kitasatospora phosalacinea]|uniref:Uncharacterized protein n=1 Tax=Kitasatospora phosalacinea TaxID=2065 RepID=A0ABW6GR80_9ACTN